MENKKFGAKTKENNNTSQFKQNSNKNTKDSTTETQSVIAKDESAKIEEIRNRKAKKQRLKLEDKNLFYSEEGIKKLYETLQTTEFKDKNDKNNLNKLMQLYKNWHMMVFPKYDFEFFTNKINEIGKKPSGKAFISRVRRIHKGEEDWSCILENQADKQEEALINENNVLSTNKTSNQTNNNTFDMLKNKNLTLNDNNSIKTVENNFTSKPKNIQFSPDLNEIDKDYEMFDFRDIDEEEQRNEIESSRKRKFDEAFPNLN